MLDNVDEYNVILSTYIHSVTTGGVCSQYMIFVYVFLYSYSVCIGQVEDRKFMRKLSLQCLVLDEGHMLKNMATQRYNHLMNIKVCLVDEFILCSESFVNYMCRICKKRDVMLE